MDDTYIHFVYAENLSRHGGLFFNISTERGVGTSSILWVLLLAGGDRIGIPLNILAKFMGLISLFILGIGIYSLLRPVYPAYISLLACLLVELSGNMLWFALSGMETVLFLALGILALRCYRAKRWAFLGILLGLLVLTRQEGIFLAIAIGIADVWTNRSIQRGLIIAGVICALLSAPWLVYLWARSGYPYPTTGIGKRLSNTLSMQAAIGDNPSLSWLSRFSWLSYPSILLGYTIEFVLGGYALPGPYLHVDLGVGSLNYRLSIWAILGLVAIIAPLLVVSSRRVVSHVKTPGWLKNGSRLPMLILMAWLVLHNLFYMFYLPSIGTASRYTSINYIALWVGLVLGLWYLRKGWMSLLAFVGLVVIAMVGALYWNRVYDADLEHMVTVRIASADYVKANLSPEDLCAAADIGALRYFSRRPIVDIAGLLDPDISRWYLQGKADQFVIQSGITCLVLPGIHGSNSDGVVDILTLFQLGQTGEFQLQRLAILQMDRERWLLGYLPVVNAQASVSIYRVVDK
jgi:hypothetical protein